MTGLATTEVRVISISSALAVPVDRPCPETRNGKPQSRAKTLAPNWAEKCDHSPSLVPGSPQASRSARATALILSSSRWWLSYGESRTTRTSTTPRTTPTAAAVAKEGVQPHAVRASASGAADAMAPS